MSSIFPSILTSYTNPNPTDRLNAPSHSGIETNQNSGLSQVEQVIGLAGASSTIGTIQYDLRSPTSNGGGHVQSANKGGTGQTSFNKGDILVASSSSVLSKLASSGNDGDVLLVANAQTSGLRWGTAVANKIAVSTSVVSYSGGAASVANVLFAASVVGSTLGINNAIRFKGVIENFSLITSGLGGHLNLNLKYGGQTVAGISVDASPSVLGLNGFVEGFIVGNGTTNDQEGFIALNLDQTNTIGTIGYVAKGYAFGASSVVSSANNDIIITAQLSGGGAATTANTGITGKLFIVDKIA